MGLFKDMMRVKKVADQYERPGLRDSMKQAAEGLEQAHGWQKFAGGQMTQEEIAANPMMAQVQAGQAQAARLQRLNTVAVPARAKVASVTPLGPDPMGGGMNYAFALEVTRDGAAPYTQNHQQIFSALQNWVPEQGTEVAVRVDPEDPTNMLIVGQ